MFQLVIPTHNRPARQITLDSLPPDLREKTLVVTSTNSDAREISSRYDHRNIIVAKNTSCIAEKRHWIMRFVEADLIMMLDDDMVFDARCPSADRVFAGGQWQHTHGGTLIPRAAHAQVRKAFHDMERMWLKEGLGMVGMSSRMGNQREFGTWAHNTRIMHCVGVARDTYHDLGLNFGQVKTREDFNIALHMLRHGYPNAVYFDVCVNPGAYGAPGGASDQRTVETSNDDAELLATIHPGLVRVVEKDYKGHPRMEVVCAWKKAAKEGGLL
jgi:hypothetical protein